MFSTSLRWMERMIRPSLLISRSLFGPLALGLLGLSSPARGEEKPADTPAESKPVTMSAEKSEEGAPAGPTDEELMLQSRVVMEQINAAKEKSFRSKAALADLRAQAIAADFGQNSTLVSVVHRNELDSSLMLVGAVYTLDGTPLFSRTDGAGLLDKIGEQQVFSARLLPGQHVLAIQYELRGRGGVFSSFAGDIITLRQQYTFKVEPRRTTTILTTVYNTGLRTRSPSDQAEVAFAQLGARAVPAAEAGSPVVEPAPVEASIPSASP